MGRLYEPLLKADDFYSSLCSNTTDRHATPDECPPQQTALTFLFTIAAVAFTTTLLPCGFLTDRLGPSTSGLISGLCLACGISSPIFREDALLLPGFVLVGVGIAFSYATALKSVFLVQSTRRTLMMAAINSLFDSSALVPLLLNILQRAGLATTGSLFAAHSVLLAVVFSLLSVGWMALLGGCRSDVADAGGTKSNIESSDARGESGSDPRWSLSLREILRASATIAASGSSLQSTSFGSTSTLAPSARHSKAWVTMTTFTHLCLPLRSRHCRFC